jgi:hypothetical protein
LALLYELERRFGQLVARVLHGLEDYMLSTIYLLIFFGTIAALMSVAFHDAC